VASQLGAEALLQQLESATEFVRVEGVQALEAQQR
jgi:hypothetical protein